MSTTGRKAMLAMSLAALAADPLLTHMRNVAYKPVAPRPPKKVDLTAMEAAEAKRARKNAKRKQNHER